MDDDAGAGEVAAAGQVVGPTASAVGEHDRRLEAREPDATAIATQTPSAETCSDGRSTVAAA